jgi:hypothetical protein
MGAFIYTAGKKKNPEIIYKKTSKNCKHVLKKKEN